MALRGLTVVAMEQAVAAPLCTCRLADMGARVIKVERPEGDFARAYDRFVHGETSSYFTWLNRGKESLVANIKDGEDAALLRRIIGKADVFVQNLAPGAAARAGFGAAELRAANPGLVTLDISGYGVSGGDKAGMKAYDLLVQAESGICSVTGTPDGPGRVGISVCDITAGLNGYNAVVTALLGRERGLNRVDGVPADAGVGEAAAASVGAVGAQLSVSLFDSAAEIMAVPLLQQAYTGAAPKRVGLAHPSIAPYGAFETAEGRKVLISIQNEREWRSLCAVLERPLMAAHVDYCTAVARVANRLRLDAAISALFEQWEHDALVAALFEGGVAYGSVNPLDAVLEHPQLRTTEYALPGGAKSVQVVAHPVVDALAEAAGVRDGDHRPVPAIGEHTEALRQEFA